MVMGSVRLDKFLSGGDGGETTAGGEGVGDAGGGREVGRGVGGGVAALVVAEGLAVGFPGTEKVVMGGNRPVGEGGGV